MSGEVHYWLADRPAGMTEAETPHYLVDGMWRAKEVGPSAEYLKSMHPGDRIALKTVTKRRTGIPFFNADEMVSVMKIHAVGTVREVDPEASTVRVEWSPEGWPREWYLWTYVGKALVRLAGDGPAVADLIDFLFHGGEQDLGSLVPLWNRYPAQTDFTWTPFYEAFATRLLDFREDREGLVSRVIPAARREAGLGLLLNDQFADGSTGPMVDIDPFTLMATFNRGMTDDNRRAVASALGESLGVAEQVPGDFDGVPVVNNQNSWFVRYAKNRQPGDIDALWDVFAAGLALADDDSPEARAVFVRAYDAAQQVSGVKWNLTQGLYWARPQAFATFDGRSRPYIAERFRLQVGNSGQSYLDARDRLKEAMDPAKTSLTSFRRLSYAAWVSANSAEVPHSLAGFARWAGMLAQYVDADSEEHDYKRAAAAAMARARDEALAGDPAWTEALREALTLQHNVLHFTFTDDVNKAVAADPEGMRRALRIVWDDSTPAALDSLADALRHQLGHVTPGNTTGLGSLLLMGADAEGNAPYKTTRVDKWLALSGQPPTADYESATARYSDMLAFLDGLAEQLAPYLGERPTRLETQGLAWITTEHEIPAEWSSSDRDALQQWRKKELAGRRAWLVRSTSTPVSQWLDDGVVSLPAAHLGVVPAGAGEKKVKTAVASGYQHLGYIERQSLTREYHDFLTTMNRGDIVAAQADDRLQLGVISGPPGYADDDSGDRLRRPVDWRVDTSVDDLRAPLKGLLDSQGAVVDITAALDALERLLVDGSADAAANPVAVDPDRSRDSIVQVPQLPGVTDELAATLHMDRAPLQEMVDLLQARQQVVLYGPPGTGKTYLALKLARHLAGPGDRSRVQLVQFHPSYAYEDFFEGFRPKETGGQATFELQPGPLRRIAAAAAGSPDKAYVLVIDELNRANLAKVFGELYFLLEYREESIQLQYRPSEPFRLPANLFFIATMNTADRSIASLDAAMRRRFSFVELHPDTEPVSGLLPRWLTARGHGHRRARLLAALNAAIEEQDRDLRIGPSYLMRAEAADEQGLCLVWKHDILPLLEEQYYGRMTRDEVHARFGLDALSALLEAEDTAAKTMSEPAVEPPGTESQTGEGSAT